MPSFDSLRALPLPPLGHRPAVPVGEAVRRVCDQLDFATHRWSWNLRRIDAPSAWLVTRGDPRNVVAVVDTGIDPNHPDLRGKVLGGSDVVSPGGGWTDDQGHGTAVAGLIASRGWHSRGWAGVAPATRLLAVKSNVHGTGHVRAEHIAAGIRAAWALGARVINLSVGVMLGEDFLTTDGLEELACTLRQALVGGCVVVCAAGPSAAAPTYPGYWAKDPTFPGLISVGGIDRRGRVSQSSTSGPHVSILAPCEGIRSTATGGGYRPFGATSAAAPHASGVAALLLAHCPQATPAEVKDWIVRGAKAGILNAVETLKLVR